MLVALVRPENYLFAAFLSYDLHFTDYGYCAFAVFFFLIIRSFLTEFLRIDIVF